MSDWDKLTDFSEWNVKVPCLLCHSRANKTVLGEHFKCEKCDHLFNKDNSPLPEGVMCFCEVCRPKPEEEPKGNLLTKISKKVKKVVKRKKKKFSPEGPLPPSGYSFLYGS